MVRFFADGVALSTVAVMVLMVARAYRTPDDHPDFHRSIYRAFAASMVASVTLMLTSTVPYH